MAKMPKNKKYYFVKNEAINDETIDKSCGQYRNLCVSPIPSSDSHISPECKASLPLTSAIGRTANRPLDCNSRVRGNVYLKSIGFISKELFESLPESKVDPDVLSYTPLVTYDLQLVWSLQPKTVYSLLRFICFEFLSHFL